MQRVIYLAVGLIIGLSLAAHSAGATVRLPAACTSPTPTAHHGSSLPYATDPNTGMSVQASHLHVDTNGDEAPKPGNQYMVVHVLIHNGGTKPQDYNALDFALHGASDQHNYQGDAFDTNIANTMLSSGKLRPGRFISGDIAFEVPKHQHYTLQWSPDFDNAPIDVPLNP